MRLSKVASCRDKMLRSDSKSFQQAFSASPENGENSWGEMETHWENQECTKIMGENRKSEMNTECPFGVLCVCVTVKLNRGFLYLQPKEKRRPNIFRHPKKGHISF